MTVFLDTVGLLAVWDQNDQWHRAAQACFSELLASRADLITSSFIMLECGNAAARRPYRSAVSRLCRQMESAQRLIVPTNEDWQIAWAAYEKGQTESPGIVDHISIAIMRRLGISKSFTNDRHFLAAGLETLF